MLRFTGTYRPPATASMMPPMPFQWWSPHYSASGGAGGLEALPTLPVLDEQGNMEAQPKAQPAVAGSCSLGRGAVTPSPSTAGAPWAIRSPSPPRLAGRDRWRDAHDYIASTVFDLVSLAGISGTMELRGIFSMAVPAEVLAAALAEDGSRRSRPGCVVGFGWMVVRFVRVIRVPACARVSRVSRVCPAPPPVSFYRFVQIRAPRARARRARRAARLTRT